MNRQKMITFMSALSIAYAATIGVLAIVNSHSIGIVALVGAIVLGVGWVTSGMVFSRERD
jgi:hypothetical protein